MSLRILDLPSFTLRSQKELIWRWFGVIENIPVVGSDRSDLNLSLTRSSCLTWIMSCHLCKPYHLLISHYEKLTWGKHCARPLAGVQWMVFGLLENLNHIAKEVLDLSSLSPVGSCVTSSIVCPFRDTQLTPHVKWWDWDWLIIFKLHSLQL